MDLRYIFLVTASVVFLAPIAGANPIAELCPTCTGAKRMCSPDRTLTLDGTAVTSTDARIANKASVRPADLHLMGATCDCTYGAEVYRSVYSGYLASGFSDPHGNGRLPGCRAEPVDITMPLLECPLFAMREGSTVYRESDFHTGTATQDAALAVPMGGTDAAPTWAVGGAMHTCIINAITACPPGYRRTLAGTSRYSAEADSSTDNACRGYAPTGTLQNGTVRLPRIGDRAQEAAWYVSAVSIWTFPTSVPRTGTCPDGTNMDSNLACAQEYEPLAIYSNKTKLENDYAASYLSTNAPQFFGDKNTQGNYYTDDYLPPCATTQGGKCTPIDQGVPSTNLSGAFPHKAGYLSSSDVGKAMIAERTAWNAIYSSLPHVDGDNGHLCVGDQWAYNAYHIAKAKQGLDDPALFFEDGQSCPLAAPLDTTTGTCVSTANVPSASAVPASSTPAVSCPGTGTVHPIYSTTDRGPGAVQVGEYCTEPVNLDNYLTVNPDPANNAADRSCLVNHADYPPGLPSNPQNLINIPQNVVNDCKRSSLPQNFTEDTWTYAHHPRTRAVSVNLRHAASRARGQLSSTTIQNYATTATPTVTPLKVQSFACRHGQVRRGWFGTPQSGFTIMEESGAFCTVEDPGHYGQTWDRATDHGCDNREPPAPTLPSGTTTPGGMGISASPVPGRGPIVEVILPNGWRHSYPVPGTSEAICAAVTDDDTCNRMSGCAWNESGTCSNTGFATLAPDCDCATYSAMGGTGACPPAFPDACPTP